MPQHNAYFALIRIRDNERPEAARRAHARQYKRTRPTRPMRIDPINSAR
jgi:hypothetical protein